MSAGSDTLRHMAEQDVTVAPGEGVVLVVKVLHRLRLAIRIDQGRSSHLLRAGW